MRAVSIHTTLFVPMTMQRIMHYQVIARDFIEFLSIGRKAQHQTSQVILVLETCGEGRSNFKRCHDINELFYPC